MRIKKYVVLLIVILLLAGAASGGVYAYQKYQQDSLEANVVNVSNINAGWWEDSVSSSGTVSDNQIQSVYVKDQTIAEVKVEEGQEVAIGDTLLVYDTAETELEIEMKKLEIQGTENDITLAERELDRLKKIKPVSTVTPQAPSRPTTTNTPTTTKKKETGVVKVKVQKKDGDAYNYIDATAKPYKGEGTPEEPYRFLCTQECYVLGEYLNRLVQREEVAAFEIWSGNSVEEGTLLTCWTVNGMELSSTSADSKWLVATQEKMEDGILLEEETETEDDKNEDESETSETESTEEVYTQEELKAEIAEKERELKELEIERKSQRLEMQSLRKQKKAASVKASINGIVKFVEDPDNPPVDGSAFMEITGSQGLYVKSAISELKLDQIEVGQEISAESWNNGQIYSAVITEISEYPSTNMGGYYGEGNPNVSYYSFLAYIEDSTGLSNGDELQVSITPVNTGEAEDSLYIEKAYVREEDGRSYVLKAGEDNRLVKQYVQTGKILYGSTVEIKSGLSLEDRIAFPYGKTAKEGVKAVESEDVYY